MRTCHCFFCAKATSLPRFENPRTAKNRPTFATGKSGLGSKCVWSPLLDDDAVGIQSKVCTKTSRRSLLLPLAKKCLWSCSEFHFSAPTYHLFNYPKANAPPNSQSLFFSGCSNPLRFTCFWCVPQRCWSRYFLRTRRTCTAQSWSAMQWCRSCALLCFAWSWLLCWKSLAFLNQLVRRGSLCKLVGCVW